MQRLFGGITTNSSKRCKFHCCTLKIIIYSEEYGDPFLTARHTTSKWSTGKRRSYDTPLPFVCQPRHRWHSPAPKSIWRHEGEPSTHAFADFGLLSSQHQRPSAAAVCDRRVQESAAAAAGGTRELNTVQGRQQQLYIVYICLHVVQPPSFSPGSLCFLGKRGQGGGRRQGLA